jgi:hypothetical protein
MNIHFSIVDGVVAKVPTGQYRQRTGERKPTKKGTQAPRTRENIGIIVSGMNSATIERIKTSAVYPGGKRLRRSMANLKRRQDARDKTCGMSSGGKGSRTINSLAFQQPGSMRMRG